MECSHANETLIHADQILDRIDALEAWGTVQIATHQVLEGARRDAEFALRWAPLPDDFDPADLPRVRRRKGALMRNIWAMSPPRRAYLARCLLALVDRTISDVERAES